MHFSTVIASVIVLILAASTTTFVSAQELILSSSCKPCVINAASYVSTYCDPVTASTGLSTYANLLNLRQKQCLCPLSSNNNWLTACINLHVCSVAEVNTFHTNLNRLRPAYCALPVGRRQLPDLPTLPAIPSFTLPALPTISLPALPTLPAIPTIAPLHPSPDTPRPNGASSGNAAVSRTQSSSMTVAGVALAVTVVSAVLLF